MSNQQSNVIDFIVNPSFLYLWGDEQHRFEVLKGGAGSGKSYSVTQRILTDTMSIPGCNSLIVRKVQRTLMGSSYALFKQIIHNSGLKNDFEITKNPLQIEHKGTGNQIIFAGLDDPEKIKSVTAVNGVVERVVVEEASELTQDEVNQLNARLRGNTGIKKQMFLMFNPIYEEHWLKKSFWEENHYQDSRLHESTYRDNKFLDAEYKKQLESYKHINPYFYSVYCEGSWGAIDEGDTIVPYHLAYEAKHRTDTDKSGKELWVGLDVARYGDDNSVAYIRRGMTTLAKRSVNGKDAKEVAEMVMVLIVLHMQRGDTCFVNVDATGVGSGVIDMLRFLTKNRKNIKINEISFGGKAENDAAYLNCVTEMYFNMTDVLKRCNILKGDDKLIPELTKRKYTIDERKSVMKIEDKKLFKKRIGSSPDDADAFVLCYYEHKGVKHPYNFLKNKKRRGA